MQYISIDLHLFISLITVKKPTRGIVSIGSHNIQGSIEKNYNFMKFYHLSTTKKLYVSKRHG